MRVETIEQLYCPASHAPSPLITVAFERDGDWLIEGLLGCSVCGAEYVMANGVVHFDALPERSADADGRASDGVLSDPMRVAALLGLSEPGMRIVLCGDFGNDAAALEHATGARCLVVNWLGSADLPHGGDRVTMPVDAMLPLAIGAMHGMAVDDTHIPQLLRAALVVRAGGRVLAPSAAPVPQGCTELARDGVHWVAEVNASASGLVALHVRRRPGAPE